MEPTKKPSRFAHVFIGLLLIVLCAFPLIFGHVAGRLSGNPDLLFQLLEPYGHPLYVLLAYVALNGIFSYLIGRILDWDERRRS